MRVTEIDVQIGRFGDGHVVGHLDTLIPGQGLSQRCRQPAHRLNHGFLDGIGAVIVGQMQQHHKPSGSLDQGPDRGLVLCPGDQVALPMPRDGTVLNFWWPLSNVDHARDLASAFTNAAAGLAQRTPRPQTLVQVAAQLAPALDIKGLIDRLVTHTHLRIAWEVDLQPGRDPVSYTHLRAHETVLDLVCRLLLEKKKKNTTIYNKL